MSKSMTLARKKMPPLRRKAEANEKRDEEEAKDIQEKLNQLEAEIAEKNQGEQLMKELDNYDNIDQEYLPEVLKRSDNPQVKINYHRMRIRNYTDGAVSINLQIDDIANENLELYDHKGINIEPVYFSDKIVDHHEAYVESLHLQKYFKTKHGKKPPEQSEKKKEPVKTEKVEVTAVKRKQVIKEQTRRTEDEIFEKFDHGLQEVMANVSNKIAIFFLFSQGLLAGICLTNIFLLFEFQTFDNFTAFYSLFAREIFNFTYFFTFVSLVGNGVKFLNSYKKCKTDNLLRRD